jgi:hypothetical protein
MPLFIAGPPPPPERDARVRAGIAPEQVLARIADVGFVADELARRPSEGACDLTRIDSDHLALAGHSMGPGWCRRWPASVRTVSTHR